MKEKTLEYYLAQDYPVEIRAIPPELGGGYSASIPHLGRGAFFADGDTVQEALEALNEVKTVVFEDMIARGKDIPDAPPLPEQESEVYSGRILLRVPRSTHGELARRAEQEGCSVNQVIVTAVATYLGGIQLLNSLATGAWQSGMLVSPEAQSRPPYRLEMPKAVALEPQAEGRSVNKNYAEAA